MRYKYSKNKILRVFIIALCILLESNACFSLTSKTAIIQEDTLHYKSFLFYRTKDLDSALFYAKMSLSQGEVFQDSVIIIKSYNAIGYCYEQKQAFDSALFNYKTGLRVSKRINNGLRSMYFSNAIGNVYDNSGKYDSALVYFYNSLELAKELNREKDEAIALTNIGNVNFDLSLNSSAISFYEQAILIKEKLNSSSLDITYYNIGLCYAEVEDHEKAILYFNRLIELCSNGNCKGNYMDRGIIGLALASWVLGDLDDCENYAKQVLDSKNVTVKMLAYRYLSLVDSERENYLDALSNIKISSSIAISMNNKEALKTNYMHQGNIYKSLERLDSALVLYDLHFALKDSLFNEDVAGGIKDMFVKLERKQAQIEIDAQEKQLENQKVVVLLLALVIVLTAILVWFIIRDLLKRKKRNLMLGNEVSYKTLQLQKSNEELFENKNDLENLIYRISHDIRAPLARLQGLVEIGKMDNSIDIHAKFEKELNDLEKILTRMAVVNSINNHKVSLVKLELSLFINSLTDKYLPQWGDVVDFDINTNGASVNTDPELLDIALFNMLDNAVRNRATGQRAKVKIGYVNKVLYIEDLGEGFDPQFINRITELFFVANDKGGTGIGLHHALLAIKRFGGSLSIKSTSNPTRFEIHFSSKNI